MKISIGSPKVLGIELENGITRVVEMEFKAKTPKVYHAMTIPSPMDLVSEDGIVRESEEFRTSFRTALKRLKISSDRVAFSISSSRIINREISIPMVKESKIETLLYQNASDYFPVNITDYRLTYNILGKLEENGKKHYKLLVCAVPRDIIRSYYQLANFLGVEIVAIDFAGNGVFQALKSAAKDILRNTVGSDKTELYISVYSEHSLLTFVREGTISLQRILAVGVSGLTSRLLDEDAQTETVDLASILRGWSGDICDSSFRRGDSFGTITEKESRTELLRLLVSSIRRSVEYYESTFDGGRIEAYLIGGIQLYSGFAELLSHELDLPVLPLETAIDKKETTIGDGFAFTASEFLAPIGACTLPVNLANRKKGKSVSFVDVFNDHSVQNTILAIGIVCFILCGAIGAALIVMSSSEKEAAELEESKLREELISYGDTTAHKNAYNNALAIYNSLNSSIENIDQYLDTNNDHFVSFLTELEQKMPSAFRVVGITVSENGVVMNVRVSSKDEAAYVIQTLRNCASVTMGTPSNIIITEDSQIIGYNISALLDEEGHLKRENISSKYANYTQEELDALIPALKNGAISPADVYSNYTAITTVSYKIDETVMSMIELYKAMRPDHPVVKHADTMLRALEKFLNEKQPDDLSVFNSFDYVNNSIFPLSDFGITKEQYDGYVEEMRSMGYDWEKIFIKSIRTEYEESGSGISLPQESMTSEILSFTISLTYTGKFEDVTSESEESGSESGEETSEEVSEENSEDTSEEVSEETSEQN